MDKHYRDLLIRALKGTLDNTKVFGVVKTAMGL